MNPLTLMVVRTAWFTIPREGYARVLMRPVLDLEGIVSLAVLLLVSFYSAARSGPSGGLRTLAIGLTIYVAFTLYNFAQARRRAHRQGTYYEVPRLFEFSDVGIEIRMEGKKDSLVDWGLVRKVVRRSGFTLLMLDFPRYYPVPDDAFRSRDDLKAFISLLEGRGLRIRRS